MRQYWPYFFFIGVLLAAYGVYLAVNSQPAVPAWVRDEFESEVKTVMASGEAADGIQRSIAQGVDGRIVALAEVSVQKYDSDDLDQAALDRITRSVDLEISTLDDLKRARTKLACVSSWAEQVPDKQVSKAYLKWVDVYGRDYDELEQRLLNPAGTQESKWDRERKAKQARADALDIPVPSARICQGHETEFNGEIGGAK